MTVMTAELPTTPTMMINQKITMSTSTVDWPDGCEGSLVFVIELLFDEEDVVFLQLSLLFGSEGFEEFYLEQSINKKIKM